MMSRLSGYNARRYLGRCRRSATWQESAMQQATGRQMSCIGLPSQVYKACFPRRRSFPVRLLELLERCIRCDIAARLAGKHGSQTPVRRCSHP